LRTGPDILVEVEDILGVIPIFQRCQARELLPGSSSPRRECCLARRGGDEIAPPVEGCFRRLKWEEEVDGQSLAADRMETEFKFRHDAEVPATAPESPKKIGVFTFADSHHYSIRGNHFKGDDVVARKAELPGKPPIGIM
jgi:hypothetical protein